MCYLAAGSADPHPLDVRRRTASENHTDTEIWLLQLLEEEEVAVVEVAEGGEVPMTEIPIVQVLQEMLRPETGASAREADLRLVGVPAEAVAEARLAAPRLEEEEEVLEGEVAVVEVPADAEAQAIAATARAAEAEAETADAECFGQPNQDQLLGIEEAKERSKAALHISSAHLQDNIHDLSTVYTTVTSGQG